MTLNQAKQVIANDDSFDVGALSFTGNTVGAANESRFALAA